MIEKIIIQKIKVILNQSINKITLNLVAPRNDDVFF